jgi:hypothetical protein
LKGAAGDTRIVMALALMAVAGTAMVLVTTIRLRPWAQRRRGQMAEVAARVMALDRALPPSDDRPAKLDITA